MNLSHRQPFKASPVVLSSLIAIVLQVAPSHARDDREPGWYDTAEFSLISTTGNSEASTFGFKNTLERLWNNARLTVGLGGLNAESDAISRSAIGTPSRFEIRDTSVTSTTAENYYLRARYDRDISERLYWFAGLGWEQNEFTGFSSRTTAIAGTGNRWWSTAKGHFYSDYGLTYTEQDDLILNPATEGGSAGLGLGWDFLYNFNASTSYTNVLTVDQNLDESDDSRADMMHSLSVSMTEKIALKLSYRLLYDNLPALQSVALFDNTGVDTGTKVLTELGDWDTVLTAALVIKF